MLMTFAEFKQAFVRHAGELNATNVNDRTIRKSYETYKFGVEFAKARGVLKFFLDENGELGWDLQ
ncbi:MAG: hypothetical protein AAF936_14150 [Pseudomonadota bacterium]